MRLLQVLLLAVCAGWGGAGKAQVCPDYTLAAGEVLAFDARSLAQGRTLSVVAGGDLDLGRCASLPGQGWIIRGPDFEFSLDGAASGATLSFDVAGRCDTVLLVNEPDGSWQFNDDGPTNYDPRLVLTARNGTYDVWIGTYNRGNCDAALTLEVASGTGVAAPLAQTPAPRTGDLTGLDAIGADLARLVRALLAGETVPLTETNMPFLTGMAGAMMERCGMPRSMATRARLTAFVGTGTIAALGGLDYSNPDLGAMAGSLFRQQGLLGSGAAAVEIIGCSGELDRIGENMARLIEANSGAGSGFVASCAGTHGERSCTCLADMGRQVMPDIASRRYSSSLMREIIERNPMLALMIGLNCGISNY